MFVMENGVDYPLGARLDEAGCHFCVWAPQSDKVELCLFDKTGQRHMEYVRQRGAFDDMPLAQIVADFRTVYSGWLPEDGATHSSLQGASFAQDVEKEARA